MFQSEWREFPSAPCLARKKPWWQLASWCCWNRARPSRASELFSLLVGLRIYQHPSSPPHTHTGTVMTAVIRRFFSAGLKCKSLVSNMASRPRKGGELWLYAVLVSVVDEVEWSIPQSYRLTPVKEPRNPLYRWLGGPQGRSGRVWRSENYWPPLPFESQTLCPAA